MNPLLLFHCRLYQSSDLICGKLILIDKDTNQIKNEYIAASGCPAHQQASDISAKGKGPIPPPLNAKTSNYWAMTTPIAMPQVKGVEGNFYQIFPNTVQIEGVERGDFGIHFDKNVPGSAGCIVLETDKGWEGLQEDMAFLASHDIDKVPVQVSYSKNW